MARILVTGADGFVGSHLVAHLSDAGHDVVAAVRSITAAPAAHDVAWVSIGDIERKVDWLSNLVGVDAVVHLAGRAHILRNEADPIAAARRANVTPTIELFRACQLSSVRRFVYVSSVHVLGHSSAAQPFTEADAPRPADPYAQSKWEAERGLEALCSQQTLPELVIVRPAAICGARAKGNLARLARLVARDVPLPFGAISAGRNFVGVRNLSHLLELCATHSAASGKTYLAADSETLSLPALIRSLATGVGMKAKLFSLPTWALMLLGTLTGQRSQLKRLTEPLLVDASRARNELGWRSETPLASELAELARSATAR